MNKHGNFQVIVLVGLFLISTSVAGYYYWQYKITRQDFLSKLKNDDQLIINKPVDSSKITDPMYMTEESLLKKENYFYWKAYDNPKYHYSIQYPFGYLISLCSGCDDPNGDVTVAPTWYRNQYYGRIDITTSNYPDGKDFEDYYNHQGGYNPGIKKITINGNSVWAEIRNPDTKLDTAWETLFL